MDHLQYDLIANDRYAALLAEAAAQQRVHQAWPDLSWRENVAKYLVAVALRIAPGNSPLQRHAGAFRVSIQS